MQTIRMPWWAWTWPTLAWLVLLATFNGTVAEVLAAAAGIALITTVFAAVYHAEVVAHRVGEPFGTIVLAVAVTIIEVALIVSVMIAAPVEKADLARDTVFAAVMIVCNGIVGLCLLWGGARYREQGFQQGGERRFGCARCADHAHADFAERGDDRPRSDIQHIAARVRRSGVAGAIRRLHFRADGAAPRLFLTVRIRT